MDIGKYHFRSYNIIGVDAHVYRTFGAWSMGDEDAVNKIMTIMVTGIIAKVL